MVNRIARGKDCDLLDVGCGPAALMRLLQKNIHYYGIDIAIHDSAPNLLQTDFVENPIKFENHRFDIIRRPGKVFSSTLPEGSSSKNSPKSASALKRKRYVHCIVCQFRSSTALCVRSIQQCSAIRCFQEQLVALLSNR